MGTGRESGRELEVELGMVGECMATVADQLDSPLRPLVLSQIRRAAPLLRAGVVLASAVNVRADGRLLHHRVHLAAALEMLFVAHNIHKLLLAPGADQMDVSVMGSTILAGDFCFSHAAVLAASTDSPDVVTIFAQALKTVSENNLKHLFDESENNNEDQTLFEAGVQAAAVLARLTLAQQEILTQWAETLSRQLQDVTNIQPLSTVLPGSEQLSDAQVRRWRQLAGLAA